MKPVVSGERIPDVIQATAADWLARRNGGFTSDDLARLDAWIAADPRHARALAEQEAVWRALCQPRSAGEIAGVMRALDESDCRSRRRFKRGGFLALGVAALLAMAVLPSRVDVGGTAVATASLRSDRLVLPDGSMAELNLGAQIAVEYEPTRRSVRLLSGEVLFTVARDPARPFVVTVGDVEVRAVGTAFSVRSGAAQVDVLVTHGCVALNRRESEGGSADPAPILVEAGGKAVIPMAGAASGWILSRLSSTEMERMLAWRTKRIEFTETPLPEAVRLFNRENSVQLILADSGLQQRRITGIFWIDDPEGFSRLLESGLQIKVEREENRLVLRSR
jgi:transmembrane sensor